MNTCTTKTNQKPSPYSDGATPKAVGFCGAACYRYFGARYYMGDVSVWLNVGPLRDKNPSMSPYMYVSGNPIELIDPLGKKIIIQMMV